MHFKSGLANTGALSWVWGILAGSKRNGVQRQGCRRSPDSHLCLQHHCPHTECCRCEGCVSASWHEGKVFAEVHLPSLTWVLANLYSEIFPSFRQSVQLFTKMGTNCRAGWHIEWVCHSFLAYSTYSLFTAENQGNLPTSSHRALASVQLVTAMSHFPCSSDTLGLVI